MNRIHELRKEKKITQVRLSIELEVSQETVSAYEMGKHYPSVKSLIKLRDIFGVNIDYILGLSNDRYHPLQISDLRDDEIALLQIYRKLDVSGREQAKAYMEGYLAAIQKKL